MKILRWLGWTAVIGLSKLIPAKAYKAAWLQYAKFNRDGRPKKPDVLPENWQDLPDPQRPKFLRRR